jgi:hypothetical protein
VGRAVVEVERAPVSMTVDQLRDVCAYAHWIPITQGLYKEFFEQNYPGWEWNDFVPKLVRKGILGVNAAVLGYTKMSQGLFVAPNIESIDFKPSQRGVQIVVHCVKEVSHG